MDIDVLLKIADHIIHMYIMTCISDVNLADCIVQSVLLEY